MKYIVGGLLNNLDVSLYANSEFSAKQMFEIMLGLLDNLDASVYANPEFSAE